MNDQIYRGPNHMVVGPPEPTDSPEDAIDRKMRLRWDCPAYDAEGGDCQVDGKFCTEHNECPMGRW